VLDTPEKLQEMEAALATLEQQGTVRVFDLQYAAAADLEERLKDTLEVNKLGYVRADERSNQLIVRTFPERMREMETLIAALDRKTREVLIDAKIVKVNLSQDMDSGINWDTAFTNLKFHGIDPLGTFRSASTGTAPSEVPAVAHMRIPTIKTTHLFGSKINLGDLVFGTVARDGYELFRYLETLGKTKLISNPRIMVTENKEAKILVGTREAYVTTTTTTGQSTSTTAEDVEFIDVGIQLSVTPQINSDGFVSMKIRPEVSSVIRTLTTPSKAEIPIVDTSTAETSVVVEDGSTVIIGGLRKQQKQFTDEQIPYLGHLPILGKLLFRQVNRDDETSELVVFITPTIVQGTELVMGDQRGTLKGFRDYAPLLSDAGAGQ
jgi:general secretion pathway protein D